MGKRHRNQRQNSGPSTRVRLEQLLAKGDTRAAVEAAKLLVREEPGQASETLAIRAYAERIKALIAEGLGREAATLASIVRERFPAHLSSWTTLLDDARLAGGDLDWILSELPSASDERRAALEERLLPWIADPAAIARSSALDPADPLTREAAIVAEVFEIVTSRIAAPEEMGRLNDIRRRSPLAPWKLLIRAMDAFYRKDDERVASNVAALDTRSPAARAGDVLSELTTGRKKKERSSAAERLIDRISGGRATIAAQIRSIEAAADGEDRRKLREEIRTFTRSFDKLSPYALEQVRLALLPLCGIHFGPEQVASLFRLGEDDPALERYGVLLMERSGLPFAGGIWTAYADGLLELREIEPWQAAEIYLHALPLGGEGDDEFVCRDPSHGHAVEEDMPDQGGLIEKIIASRPAPSVLARLTPYIDRLKPGQLQRVLAVWRKSDPKAPEPLVRLLAAAEKDRRHGDALALIREGDALKILDPEYARLRLRVMLRKAEQLLSARKYGAAALLLDEIASRPEDLGEDAGAYLLALQWAAAPPAKAGELLAQLAGRGVVGEIVVAEVTGDLGIPFALPATHPSPEELLDGILRGSIVLRAVGKVPLHSAWLVERAELHLDRATEAQLLVIAGIALVGGMSRLAWKATARGLEMGGPMLHRVLLMRAEVLLNLRAERSRTFFAIEAARTLAQRARDSDIIARAAELAHGFPYSHYDDQLSSDETQSIVDFERTSPMLAPRASARRKAPAKKKEKQKKEKGLFEP